MTRAFLSIRNIVIPCAVALCVVAAPEVFSQNADDGLVIGLQEYPPQHLHEACREAARLCPALVISFDE